MTPGRVALLLVALAVFAGCAAGAPQGPVPRAVTAEEVARVVDGYRAATEVPGLAVAVTRRAEVVTARGWGRLRDGAVVTDRTPMALASVSKSMTALAVMQLVEDRRVRLDAPGVLALPEFALADPRSTRAVTVRDLLVQTSGLTDAVHPATSGPQPRTLAEAVAQLRAVTPATAPGTAWSYHNPNYAVAARLVEVVSGEPFDAYLARRVLGPAGMHDARTVDDETGFPPGHVVLAGRAIGAPEPAGFAAGSGGVVASARDLAAWLIAQTGGAGVLSPAGLAVQRTPTAASGSYALGWQVGTTRAGTPLLSHSGSLFTATAYQAVLPTTGYGVAVTADTGLATADAARLGDALVALVDAQQVPPPGRAGAVVFDVTCLLLAAACVVLGVRGVRRARVWAVGRSRARRLATLVPLLVPIAAAIGVGRLVTALDGLDVGWTQVPFVHPGPAVLLAGAALASLAVLVARGAAQRGRPPGRPREPLTR